MEDKQFIRHNILLFSTTTIAFAVHYLFQFFMGRMLGPEDYGVLAALFSILYIAIAPVQAVQLTVTKFVAELKADRYFGKIKDMSDRTIKKIFLVSVIMCALFIALSKQIASFLNIQNYAIVIVFSFIFIAYFITAAARGFLQGLQKFKLLGLNLIAESFVKLIISTGLVIFGFGVVGAVWGLNVSIVIAFLLAIVLLFKILKKYTRARISDEQKKEMYKYSFPMLVALSSVTFLYSIDVILVKHFFPSQEAGIYAAAALVAKVIFFALLPISQVMFPKITALKTKREDYSTVFFKSIAIVTLLSGVATFIYFAFPQFVFNFLFGAAYADAVPLVGIFGAAISVLSISYVLINYFLSSGKLSYVYILPFFAIAQTFLIWFFHSTLYNVLLQITGLFSVLLVLLLVLYFIGKHESFANNPSIQ